MGERNIWKLEEINTEAIIPWKNTIKSVLDLVALLKKNWNFLIEDFIQHSLKKSTTLINYDELVDNKFLSLLNKITKLLAKKKYIKIIWKDHLQEVVRLQEMWKWVMFIAPHQSFTIEAAIFASWLYESKRDLFDKLINILRIGLFDSKSKFKKSFQSTLLLACRSIVTTSEKEQYIYWDKISTFSKLAWKTILRSLRDWNLLFLYPEWTRWAIQSRWMLPIPSWSLTLLDLADKYNYYVVSCYSTWLWEKTSEVSLTFEKPILIKDLQIDKPMPKSFKDIFHRAYLIQTVSDILKEMKSNKVKFTKSQNNILKNLIQRLSDWEPINSLKFEFLCNTLIIDIPETYYNWLKNIFDIKLDEAYLQRAWKYWRFMAMNLPENMRWVYS